MSVEPKQDAYLYAVLRLDHKNRIQCQNDGCGHSVYAAIYVVRQADKFMLLGRDCFSALYGHEWGLGRPRYMPNYQSGSGGRLLSAQERLLLIENTAAFVEKLEIEFIEEQEREKLILAQRQKSKEEHKRVVDERNARLQQYREQLKNRVQPFVAPDNPVLWAPDRENGSTFFCHRLRDGTCWVLYMSLQQDYRYRPWPEQFSGWDECWPASVGAVNSGEPFYRVNNLGNFLRYMKERIASDGAAFSEAQIITVFRGL